MTKPNMEWEKEFERAWMRTIYKGGFLQEHTNIPQAILVKSFIRKAISQAEQRGYEKGAAEEREKWEKHCMPMNDSAILSLIHDNK